VKRLDRDAVSLYDRSLLEKLFQFGEPTMTYHDKVQLTIIIIAPPDQAAEGDRLFKSHGAWMESTALP
jgi:hypothetical protein